MEVELIYAPFTDEQVKNLNAWQNNDSVHPFTCGNGHVLTAIKSGWICKPDCSWTQNWAHAFMGMVRP